MRLLQPLTTRAQIALVLLIASAPLSAEDKTVKAPSVDAALAAAARAIETVGFKRSYFGTFSGVMRVQGTWPVTFGQSCRGTAVIGGVAQGVETRSTETGEVIADITASPAGSGSVKVKATLMPVRAKRSECSVTGKITGAPPKGWEDSFFAELERVLVSSAPVPRPQAGGALEIARRYGFDVAVDGRKVMVAAVRDGGRAQVGGLRRGDEILRVFDAKANTNVDLLWSDMLSGHMMRNALLLQVRGADGSKRDVRITDRY